MPKSQSTITPVTGLATKQLRGWNQSQNQKTINKITLFFESLAVIIIFAGIIISIAGLI